MKPSRRNVLLGAAAGVAGVGGIGAAARAAETQTSGAATTSSGVKLKWLGTAAWEISSGESVLLNDPWVTRFKTGTFTPEGADPNTKLVSKPAVIDKYITKADAILVHHGHYDHLADVPYVARKTGAVVFGTESHLNMLRALRAPDEQLSQVSGGEWLPFKDFTVEVYRSLHSCSGKRHNFVYPGTRPGAVPPRPRVISDLVEGGTLAYVITIGGARILSLSSANFIADELRDLQVDAVLAAPGGEPGITERLLRTIKPVSQVIASHWDDFDKPLDEPAVDAGGLEALRKAVTSTGTKFTTVDHLESVTL